MMLPIFFLFATATETQPLAAREQQQSYGAAEIIPIADQKELRSLLEKDYANSFDWAWNLNTTGSMFNWIGKLSAPITVAVLGLGEYNVFFTPRTATAASLLLTCTASCSFFIGYQLAENSRNVYENYKKRHLQLGYSPHLIRPLTDSSVK